MVDPSVPWTDGIVVKLLTKAKLVIVESDCQMR